MCTAAVNVRVHPVALSWLTAMAVTVGTPGEAATALGPAGGSGDGGTEGETGTPAGRVSSGVPVELATATASPGVSGFIIASGRTAATQTAPTTPMTARSAALSGPGIRHGPIRTGLPIAAARMLSPPA